MLVNSSQLTALETKSLLPSCRMMATTRSSLICNFPTMLSFSASTLVTSNLCGISRFWHQLPTCLSVNRQGSLLAVVNLPWLLNPHTHQHPGWCELPSCVLRPRWKGQLWYLQTCAIFHRTPNSTWNWYDT